MLKNGELLVFGNPICYKISKKSNEGRPCGGIKKIHEIRIHVLLLLRPRKIPINLRKAPTKNDQFNLTLCWPLLQNFVALYNVYPSTLPSRFLYECNMHFTGVFSSEYLIVALYYRILENEEFTKSTNFLLYFSRYGRYRTNTKGWRVPQASQFYKLFDATMNSLEILRLL